MAAMVPDLQNLQHGRDRIWCMDCHHTTQRNKLVDNFGDPVSFDQPQLLCGKCHGDKLRDWRDGIHGKRIGDWASTGKKRWFTCTECHNPHNVQDGARNRGFVQLAPESATAASKRNERHQLGNESHGVAPLMADFADNARRTRRRGAFTPSAERGDPTWVSPALTSAEVSRTVGKTSVFFGPPLAILSQGQKNTHAHQRQTEPHCRTLS
jgi:hypothetical protein